MPLILYFHVIILNLIHIKRTQMVSDILIGLGAAGILLFCYQSQRAQKELGKSFYTMIGEYSFSIYLVHCVVFIPIIHLLWATHLSILTMEIISLPFIFAVAIATYHLIENSSRKLGIKLSSRSNINK